jgi:autotransporter-associated beta strand protein
VSVASRGRLIVESQDTIAGLSLLQGGLTSSGAALPRLTVTGRLDTVGGDLFLNPGRLEVHHIVANSNTNGSSRIHGLGVVVARGEGITLDVADGPQPIDLAIDVPIQSLTAQGIVKSGPGRAQLSQASNGHLGPTSIVEGTLVVTGRQPASLVRLIKGTLTGTGTVGSVIAEAATLAPGLGPGLLATGSLTFAPETTVAVELNQTDASIETDASAGHDQLLASGKVTLGNAALLVSASVAPPSGASFTIIDNDGTDPVDGTFAGLAEGAKMNVQGVKLTISYRGGDGNDVVLSNGSGNPFTYFLAEGATGDFFDNDILIANANAEATTATLTFLRENATPFVTTVPVAPFARKTVYAGDYPELAGRAFGVAVDADQPMIAERAMYFATQPGRIWVGGHVNTGIVEPSTSWFHAEGATGSFFTTFILLSNPQDTEAKVELRFMLDNGAVVTKNKTIAAKQRLTINPAVEDAQLANAALSTVVQSDVPIVSERSMYWQEGVTPFGEGHNSTGVVSPATRWGLAEGRVGGPREFVTYILLANPSATAADVTVTYVREGGAPVVKTYTVPPTSRFNIDVKSAVPELEGASFGAVINVTNGVPIAVERSLYWNANGALWAGGTNALGTPIPEP